MMKLLLIQDSRANDLAGDVDTLTSLSKYPNRELAEKAYHAILEADTVIMMNISSMTQDESPIKNFTGLPTKFGKLEIWAGAYEATWVVL